MKTGAKGKTKGKGRKGKKSGKGNTRNAFTVKVKDVGSDEVRDGVVNKELISTILGLQAGTV